MKNAQKSYVWNIRRSIIFGNENFINAKKVLNFIQSLINEKKVSPLRRSMQVSVNLLNSLFKVGNLSNAAIRHY